ncbi:WxcM-like domain-containing protein [Algoriphagus sp. A40]|uniref:WxcM-like domain-containing protein n=1 Tax=Algoriphagus sp. A40 TaxID=1945863 RepID=UPI0009D41E58|nr:WxcM-like domain-containing protein [Algoriphagus sp. A40]OOG67953.1 hypothetical protein B0E43_22735 [Algoriphagus sp. A40]
MNSIHSFDINFHHDSRGRLEYCNDFDLSGFKRFYMISPSESGQIRAWQAHKSEEKVFVPIYGKIKLVLVPILDWTSKEVGNPLVKILDCDVPALVHVPGGFANGFQFLDLNAKLMVFSNFSLKESKQDDFRFDSKEFFDWHQ